MIQLDSGQWGICDYQAQAVAKFVRADRTKSRAADAVRPVRASGTGVKNRGIRYLESTRHFVEVEHFSYRESLRKLIKQLV